MKAIPCPQENIPHGPSYVTLARLEYMVPEKRWAVMARWAECTQVERKAIAVCPH